MTSEASVHKSAAISSDTLAVEFLCQQLLGEVVDSIGRLVPLQVDAETQRLLDTAIEYQETGECDDLEGWASRLVDDVKDADD